ncbi:MAG: DUF1848 domain-containing protein [Eubacteriales bacterium]
MIISASRRTDIPCYYSEWFMKRVRAGYVLTRNPMNPSQVSRIALSPEVVDCIVFWTKDASNLLPYLEELDGLGYNYYFQFSLTPYGRDIEKNLRDKSELMESFRELSERIGRKRVIWRYDPIILNDTLTVEYHMEHFSQMCSELNGCTDRVTISFVDMYPKLKTALLREITDEEIASLSIFIGKTAKEHGLAVSACCERDDLSGYGIDRASCIDRELIEEITGCPMKLARDKNQREGCGCAESVDIGSYNTCVNGCVYCYANNSVQTARRRYEAHNPDGELIAGSLEDNAVVKVKDTKSSKA